MHTFPEHRETAENRSCYKITEYFRINSPDEGELFLGGIHPDFQGQGIYLSFLCRPTDSPFSQNARRIVISTQLDNIAVQKVLTRFGFEISRGYYTYHKWFD
jgi:RimJ/RimL family protein N-acetyltransferase